MRGSSIPRAGNTCLASSGPRYLRVAIMKRSLMAAFTMAAVGSFASLASHEQSSDSSLQMPYQKEFWTTGHAGIELGRSRLDIGCPTGATCDQHANAAKLFAGGRFNNVFGGEVSYLQTNNFGFLGGKLKLQAVYFVLLACVQIASNRYSSVLATMGIVG